MKKRKIFFACLWLLSLSAISFYGGSISYGFFFGMTFLPVISGLYLLYIYCRFLIYQKADVRQVVSGQPVPYYFVLQNNDFITYTGVSVRMFSDFSYVDKLPDKVEYELLPGNRFRYETKLTCKYRGEYHIGVKEIILTDLFRLFQIRYRIPYPIKAVVLPKIVKVNELRSVPEVAVQLQSNRAFSEAEPDAAVRDYVQGDSLKRIHWKATAKEQKLKVRRMLGEEKTGIIVLCDTKRISEKETEFLPPENKILETLIAVSYFFAEKNTRMKLLYEKNGIKQSILDGIWHFDAFYHEISHMWFEKESEFSLLLEETLAGGTLSECRILFMIVHSIDNILLEKASVISAGGASVIIYVITDKDISGFQRQSSARVKIVPISPEEELEVVL